MTNNEAIALFAFIFFTKALSITFKDFFNSNTYFHNHKTRSSFKIHKEQARTNYKKNIISELNDLKFARSFPYSSKTQNHLIFLRKGLKNKMIF